MSSGPTFQVILVDADGNPITSGNPLPIGSGSGGTITLDVGDIEIGAVELKDADGTARVNVGPGVAANALRVVMASNDAVMATLATQTTLAAVLAKLSADPATQTTLAAVLAKLSSDPATQTTLAAVLAKISSDPATQTSLAALVTANHTDLAAILAKLTSDPATQTTLAAVLAKLTSDPATQTTLAALVTDTGGVTETAPATDTASSGLNGRLQRVAQRITSLIALLPTALGAGGGLKVDGSGTSLPVTASAGTNLNTSALALETGGNLATIAGKDFATQTTLAAVLAKLIAAPATEAKQDSGITQVTAINTVLGTTAGAAVITDASGTAQQYLRGLIKQWIAGTLVVGAGSNRIGKVGSDADVVGGNFTRPNDTTPYAIGDLVANNTSAGSVLPITVTASLANDGKVAIPRIRLKKSGTSLTNASFRVHFYKDSPTFTNGDNGVWLTTESTYIGGFDVTLDKAFSDGAKGNGVPLFGNFILAVMSSGTMNIYAVIEARAAYTPVAQEVFTLACEVLQLS